MPAEHLAEMTIDSDVTKFDVKSRGTGGNSPFRLTREAALLRKWICSLFFVPLPWVPSVVASTFNELRDYSSMHSIGVEWDVAGDDNHNAEGTVRYRVAGTSNWKSALPLIRIDFAGTSMLAGSILFLEPGTTYEVQVDVSDVDGGADSRTLVIPTRPIPVAPSGGRTLHVVPGAGAGDGSAATPFQGLQTAWAAAQPGDTILVHAGAYGGVRDGNGSSGTPGNPIVFKAYGDGEAVFEFIEVFNQSHLWFEGLTFRREDNETGFYSCLTNPGYDNGFQQMPHDIDNIVLVRNTFEGYTHSIRLGPRTSGWYVADNIITGDKELGQSGTASFDGEGIELAHGDNHVVAHNSITLVADGVSFPNRNCEIFGNDVFDVTDDGIELDGGQSNTRAWGNRIHNAGHNGIGFQPMSGAPWYLVRNQIVNYQESAFKFRTTDRFVALHNTFVNWGYVFDHWAHHLFRGITRNNLFISINDGRIWKRADGGTDWRTDMDYDGFDWASSPSPFTIEGSVYGDLQSFSTATGQESHGIRVHAASCFEVFDVPGPPPHTTIPPQLMTLNASCAAVNAGESLPNINDGYVGSAPDMGAYEVGGPLPHYGPRESEPPTIPDPPTDLQVE